VSNPAVSVVIPCFNQEQFLCDAIASTRSNTLQPEIIVVDDGSAREISATTRTSGVTCIRQENQGVVAARNRGLAAAHGEFIVFLDADDRLLPGALDTGAAALRGNPDCALVWGRCVMMDEAGSLLDTPVSPRVDGDAHAAFLRNNYIWTPAAAMLRTSIVREAGGFAHGFDAAADYDLYLRVTRHSRACDLGGAVAGYRRHGGNMSGSATRMLRDTLAVMRRHRPHDAALMAHWRAGCAMWRDFYGTQLIEELRHDLRKGAMSDVATKAWTLARLSPGVLWRETRKKAALTAKIKTLQGKNSKDLQRSKDLKI
jgi:glycosyltransferase involved in cell wall biosynthesis